jgi:UPF0716 protein FxsA
LKEIRLRAALVLIVLALPFLDLWGLWELVRFIGPLPTLALVVVAAVIGIAIIRSERVRMGPRLQALREGGAWSLPSLLYTFRRLVAGILLMYPGVLSDVVAVILLLLPEQTAGATAQPASARQIIDGEFRRVEPANDADEGH